MALVRGDDGFLPHSSHWGVFSARWQDGRLEVRPHPGDPDPNQIIENFPGALHHRARITQPMVRRGWLERGPGPDDRRGRDEYVPMAWEAILDLLGAELARVRDDHGPGAVFGGSYGWASAGRFHHAQSQLHRFLNTALGGYVRSVNSYSSGASSVLIPHIIGDYEDLTKRNVSWDQVAEHSDIVLAFGGMALKNSMIAGGGISQHVERPAMARARARGCQFVLVGPLRADLPDEAGAEWISSIPGTDTALMMAIVHTLVVRGLHDQRIPRALHRGMAHLRALSARRDGWPAQGCPAGPPRSPVSRPTPSRTLPSRLHGRRSLIVVSHSLQRAKHGEQPVWMGAVLAAALGQIGLPGRRIRLRLGGDRLLRPPLQRRADAPPAAGPQRRLRLHPRRPHLGHAAATPAPPIATTGKTRTYPDIRLVYWAGGNPFHHHQDLTRLRQAFRQIDTLVVHELAWTATARHADFVLPCTMTLEREDIGGNPNDPLLVAMHPVTKPHGEARDDYAIFSGLAERLGTAEAFTEGRTVRQWLEYLYEPTRAGLAAKDLPAPSFDEFWALGTHGAPAAAR